MPSAVSAPDFAAEGLLGDLDGEAREAREELLGSLHAAGVPLDELRRAVDADRLALLPLEHVLGGTGRYTGAEVAQAAGLDLDRLLVQRRASGLPVPGPDERAYTDADVDAARAMVRIVDAGLPEEGRLEATRVFGEATAKAAAAARSLIVSALTRSGDTERDLALRLAQAAEALNEPTSEILAHLFRLHMQEQVRHAAIDHGAIAAGRAVDTQPVAVCFADLVGFTRLGESVDPEDLGTVATRFTAIATEVVEPPVSLVKMVGDAAMLVAPEPAPVLEAALGLVERAEAEGEDFPVLRAGVAVGEALNRWGDWYGSPVNLASRVCAIARPSSVLATGEAREGAREDFAWSRAGRRKVKGIRGEVPLFRCRRAGPEEDEVSPTPEEDE